MMNYFGSKTVAERYASGRPDFHPNTIWHVRDFLGIQDKLGVALDIACGTGLSTKALLTVAGKVYGTDISAEMLNLAYNSGDIVYQVAPAEKQPFDNERFDLVTVSSGVHWFDIDSFLNEVRRILKPKCWLVIYENYFAGEMEGNDDFKGWLNEVYLEKFPSPPRNKNYDWSARHMKLKKFTIKTPVNFKNLVSFNKGQLISYFTTQSNIIAAVNNGGNYAEIEHWLDNELSVYFNNDHEERIIKYGNWIKYLQKM